MGKFGDNAVLCFLLAYWILNVWRRQLPLRLRKLERVAEHWPAVTGRFSSGSVAILGERRYAARMQYSYSVSELQTGTYSHVFASRDEAQHLIAVLQGQRLNIHYDPANPARSTLLWRELEPLLAPRPFVPEPRPVARGFARATLGAAAAGLIVSAMVLAAGIAENHALPWYLFIADLVGAIAILIPVGILKRRLLATSSRLGVWRAGWQVLPEWQRWALALLALAGFAEFMRYSLVFRAAPMAQEFPDTFFYKWVGGALLFSYATALAFAMREQQRRRRPAATRSTDSPGFARSPT